MGKHLTNAMMSGIVWRRRWDSFRHGISWRRYLQTERIRSVRRSNARFVSMIDRWEEKHNASSRVGQWDGVALVPSHGCIIAGMRCGQNGTPSVGSEQ
jgi:hypothetical protein